MACRLAWALGLRGKVYGKLHCMWLDAHCAHLPKGPTATKFRELMKQHAAKALTARYKEWRRKRKWNAELQLYHLRVMVMADNRWMAHSPIVSELTDRYLRMLSDHWESQPQESVERFRERIGLDPHKRSNV